MDKGKIAGGILSLTLVGLAIGYVVATGYLILRYGLSTERIDFTLLAREYRGLGTTAPKDFLWVNLILGGFGVAALLLSVTLLGEALTRFAPVSYFWICWNLIPTESASCCWVMPTIQRRWRIRLPTCTSTGCFTFRLLFVVRTHRLSTRWPACPSKGVEAISVPILKVPVIFSRLSLSGSNTGAIAKAIVAGTTQIQVAAVPLGCRPRT